MNVFDGMENIIKAVNDKLAHLEEVVEYYRTKSDRDELRFVEAERKLNEANGTIRGLEERIAELETEWQGDEPAKESDGDF